MRLSRSTFARLGAPAALFLSAASCGEVPAETGNRLQLQFSPLYLSGFGVSHFDVTLYSGPWTTGRPPVLFEAKCAGYATDAPSIGPLETGSGLTLEVAFYADAACTQPVLRGGRGGIDIVDGAPTGTYFIPVFPTGGFRAFPQFDPALRDAAAAVTCSADSDCRIANPDGSYQLSAVAFCDAGKCALPETAYPLDMVSPRAFHTATALPDGRIAFVGGVARQFPDSPGALLGTDETVEVFSPGSMTFDAVDVQGLQGQRMAMHDAVLAKDGSIAVFGGATQLDLSFNTGGATAGLVISIPEKNLTSTENVLQLASRIDLSTERAEVGALPKPLVGARAVTMGDGKVLLTGGHTLADGNLETTATALECTVGAGAPPACDSLGALKHPRAGHCAFCEDAGCDSIVLLGGAAIDGGTASDVIAELYDGESFSSIALGSGDLQSNIFHPTCAGGVVAGGTPELSAPPASPPLVLSVSDVVSGVAASGLDAIDSPFRVYSAAVALSDGSVLVTGGLDETGKAQNTAYRIDDGEIVDVYTMAAARFGHTATLITVGPLSGAVIVAGGLSTTDAGGFETATGAELFLP